MIAKNVKKLVGVMLIVITLIIATGTYSSAATDITSADIKYVKDCGSHLQAKDKNGWYTIVASYVEYTAPNGIKYPAYCLDNTKPGVGNSIIGDLPEGYKVDVSKVLENNQVYTAVINGYPYKTPKDLGVEDKYDAYIATKQAVYSVLYNYNVDEHYKGVDARGEKIKKAIKNIVKIAREKTKTQKSALIRFEKVGEFGIDEKDSSYYSIKYKATCDIDMEMYEIISQTGFTENTVITDIENNRINAFNAPDEFKILIPRNEIKSGEDINFKINIKAKCKNKPVFYGSKSSKLQPYALTYDTYGDNYASIELNVNMNTGKLQLNKISEKTKEPIEGVTFRLMQLDGTEIETKKTDANGMIIFENLYEGKYIVQEIETGDKYILNEEPFEVEIKYNETTNVSVENKEKEEPKKPEEPPKTPVKKLPRTGF